MSAPWHRCAKAVPVSRKSPRGPNLHQWPSVPFSIFRHGINGPIFFVVRILLLPQVNGGVLRSLSAVLARPRYFQFRVFGAFCVLISVPLIAWFPGGFVPSVQGTRRPLSAVRSSPLCWALPLGPISFVHTGYASSGDGRGPTPLIRIAVWARPRCFPLRVVSASCASVSVSVVVGDLRGSTSAIWES
ncbi:hypothetical protein NDU88_004977 [Pleurodeles waltl]|uniref:Uncharacterized protein n=1 Tax=Pleurodeles waltl TaxID=8319 RepID=A0AAV7WAP6_PLEWA|nr:hypothetical protein NDU88_004977 [Pleurodeles waltl]